MLPSDDQAAFDDIVRRNEFAKDWGIRGQERKLNRRRPPDFVVEHRHQVLLSNWATAAILIGALVVLFVVISGGGA